MLRSALGRRALAAPRSAVSSGRNGGAWRALSSRQAALLETQVMEQLRTIQDGLGLGDIASLGRVKDLRVTPETGEVKCKTETPTPALTDLAEQWRAEAAQKVGPLELVKAMDFEITAPRLRNARAATGVAALRVGAALSFLLLCWSMVASDKISIPLEMSTYLHLRTEEGAPD